MTRDFGEIRILERAWDIKDPRFLKEIDCISRLKYRVTGALTAATRVITSTRVTVLRGHMTN